MQGPLQVFWALKGNWEITIKEEILLRKAVLKDTLCILYT